MFALVIVNNFWDTTLVFICRTELNMLNYIDNMVTKYFTLPDVTAWPKTDSYCPSINRKNSMGTSVSFQFRNEQFSARSRKTRGCAEAYRGTSHKQPRSLTPRLRKRAIYGWKLAIEMPLSLMHQANSLALLRSKSELLLLELNISDRI